MDVKLKLPVFSIFLLISTVFLGYSVYLVTSDHTNFNIVVCSMNSCYFVMILVLFIDSITVYRRFKYEALNGECCNNVQYQNIYPSAPCIV